VGSKGKNKQLREREREKRREEKSEEGSSRRGEIGITKYESGSGFG
jgi:hypothetical protein